MNALFRVLWVGLAAVSLQAGAAETIKIAIIDPLSGPFANVGEAMVRHVQLAIDMVNARGGVLGGTKFELVTFDSKSNPQEAQLALKQAIDQGIHYVNQTNGSNIAGALVDAVSKNNERNPDQTVLYMNTGAVDPALTNDRCSFWHFRFDADADMKMSALSDAIAQDKKIKKIYLINQDYAFGQAVAKAGHAMVAQEAARRTDRRRRTASARQDQGFRAVRGEDQIRRSRHRAHRQLGQRHDAAGEAPRRMPATRRSSTPTTRGVWAPRPRWAMPASAISSKSRSFTPTSAPTRRTSW